MIRRGDDSARPANRQKVIVPVLAVLLWLSGGYAAHAAVTDSIRFLVLDKLLDERTLPESTLAATDPFEAAARAVAGYYNATTRPGDDMLWLSDPLRIPDPFESSSTHSPELFDRAVTRLGQFGLVYEISYPASFAEAEEIAAGAVVRGHPVLAIHPRPFLLFGFDYREPDPFWFARRFSPAAGAEIITGSKWRAEWWLWEPDPASVTLLEITGLDTTTHAGVTPGQVLERILTAARTDTTAGVTSYIRPILHVKDTLSNASAPPQTINTANDPSDPLYLHLAGSQRTRLQEFLKALIPQARDSTAVQILRLAMYSAGKAAEEYNAAAQELYTLDPNESSADSLTAAAIIALRWVEHRLEAAKHLSEALRWEKQTLTAIKDITGMKKPFHP